MSTIYQAFQQAWSVVGGFLPRFIGAIVILLLGWLVAIGVGSLVKRVVKMLGVDSLMNRLGLGERMSEYNITVSEVLGWFAKWSLIVITLIAVANTLQITQLSNLLVGLAYYIPNVIVAFIILVVGYVVGKFLGDIASSAMRVLTISDTAIEILSSIVRWAVVLFASAAALIQLGVAPQLIQIVFAGIVIMLALAGGLAFGLGGRDAASRVINQVSNEVKRQGR